MTQTPTAISLLELNLRLNRIIDTAPGLHEVWIVAETADVRVSGGHCYMELVEKDPDRGNPLAKARATIWASRRARLDDVFRRGTGSPITSGIKVMVRVNVNFHPVYGMSLDITDIDPSFTLGDLLRRRKEILDRLQREGVMENNRRLVWPVPMQRIAVISAQGAAGYGDFVKHIYKNPDHIRVTTTLFPAVMQGRNSVPSIIEALAAVYAEQDDYDAVVIIRGGGSTDDLACFDDYELGRLVATFPLPVIVGIGHERDTTVLDFVANLAVKTPTDAAVRIIEHGRRELDRLGAMATGLLRLASRQMMSAHRRLDMLSGALPSLTHAIIERNLMRVDERLAPDIAALPAVRVKRSLDRLDAIATLVEALSPRATLRRGFSITRIDGRAVTDTAAVPPGSVLTTTLASGTLQSITLDNNNPTNIP